MTIPSSDSSPDSPILNRLSSSSSESSSEQETAANPVSSPITDIERRQMEDLSNEYDNMTLIGLTADTKEKMVILTKQDQIERALELLELKQDELESPPHTIGLPRPKEELQSEIDRLKEGINNNRSFIRSHEAIVAHLLDETEQKKLDEVFDKATKLLPEKVGVESVPNKSQQANLLIKHRAQYTNLTMEMRAVGMNFLRQELQISNQLIQSLSFLRNTELEDFESSAFQVNPGLDESFEILSDVSARLSSIDEQIKQLKSLQSDLQQLKKSIKNLDTRDQLDALYKSLIESPNAEIFAKRAANLKGAMDQLKA